MTPDYKVRLDVDEDRVIAVFPLYDHASGSNVDTTIGIVTHDDAEIKRLGATERLDLAMTQDIHFNEPDYWFNEIQGADSLSDAEQRRYGALFAAFTTHHDRRTLSTCQAARNTLWQYLLPAHQQVFDELQLIHRITTEIKLKRFSGVESPQADAQEKTFLDHKHSISNTNSNSKVAQIIDNQLIAIFPLGNRNLHTPCDMAIGILLHSEQETDKITDSVARGLDISAANTVQLGIAGAEDSNFDDPNHWFNENCIPSNLSDVEEQLYFPLLAPVELANKLRSPAPMLSTRNALEKYLSLGQRHVFEEMGFYHRPIEERRFRRLFAAGKSQAGVTNEIYGCSSCSPWSCAPKNLAQTKEPVPENTVTLTTEQNLYLLGSEQEAAASEVSTSSGVFPHRKLRSADQAQLCGDHVEEYVDDHPALDHAERSVNQEQTPTPPRLPRSHSEDIYTTHAYEVAMDDPHDGRFWEHFKELHERHRQMKGADAQQSAAATTPPINDAPSVAQDAQPVAEDVKEVLDEDDSDTNRRRIAPLIPEVGKHFLMLTPEEAERAEESWVEEGEEWFERARGGRKV